MSPKAILIFCAQALLAQSAFSYCAGNRGIGAVGLGGYDGCGCGSGLAGGYSGGLGYGAGYGAGLGYGSGYGCNSGVASTGGGLPVSSASPIAPVGVTVLSENAYEGQLCAGGNLPFLGSVALDGVLPTSGSGAVSYGCGDGAISIGNEGPVSTGITIPGAIFPPSSPNSAATADALALVGNGAGLAGYGRGIGSYGLAGAGYGLGGRGCGCSCGY